MKKSTQNALEIVKRGMVIKSSDWTTGSGNFVAKRAIPAFCKEIVVGGKEDIDDFTIRSTAMDFLRCNSKVRKIIVVTDLKGLITEAAKG